MNLSKLLSTRQTLLRQAHLANLAHSYVTLSKLADRIENANLRGVVRLQAADAREERFCASLTALENSQAVIEEHFDDADLLRLADGIAFAREADFAELEFHLEDLRDKYVAPLRTALERAGVKVDADEQTANRDR
jgi:hypothetical protein